MTDTQVMAALEPCPVSWCDDSRPHVFNVTATLRGVRCNECGTKTPGYWTEAEAVATWNRRASSPEADPVAFMVQPLVGGVRIVMPNDIDPERAAHTNLITPLYAAPVPSPAGDAEGLTVADAWQDLVDKDDRTSPKEYPDMALITREELADYMRAATPPSVPAQQGWLPIETAPKDGTWVLVCEAEFDDTVPAHYAASMHPEGYWMANCGQHVTEAPSPTHWMPLPATPPSQDQKGVEG